MHHYRCKKESGEVRERLPALQILEHKRHQPEQPHQEAL